MRKSELNRRGGRMALILAPILALAACDQIGDLIGLGGGSGPAILRDVAPEARSIGGAAVSPESEMAGLLEKKPPEFIPGELLIGAKVDGELAEAASEVGIPFMARLSPDGSPNDIDPKVFFKALEDAVVEADKDAEAVLKRMRIDGDIEVSATGVVKIDLAPEKASPTAYARMGQAAAPDAGAPQPGGPAADPAAVEPEAIADTGQRCPANVTPAQLEADLALKTICVQERLRASRQFDYVEKNYVIQANWDWRPKPAPKPTTPTTPGAPAAPSAPEQAAVGALPNDPLLSLQWHYRPRGAGAGQSPGGSGLETYWLNARQVGKRSVNVAVIDTGVDLTHPDMNGSPNLTKGIDLIVDLDRAGDGGGIDEDANDVGDACGVGRENSFHGTHVAGTVGATVTNDRKGVAGGAWNVTVVPVRAIGRCGGELEDIINGIRWAAGIAPALTEDGREVTNQNPADIINMSLSVGIPCPASMQAAIDAAYARGSVVVVAAGNKSSPVASYAPANCQRVIVVAANDARGNIAFYSNFGPEVDVLAPGGDVFNDSDGDGRPDGVLSTRTTRTDCYDPQTGEAAAVCYYGYLQGTSMAAPHVAAALALLQSQFNVKGRALEERFFGNALGQIDAGQQCAIDCARNSLATPIADRPGMCMRQCGRGMLDMARAAPSVATAAAPGGR